MRCSCRWDRPNRCACRAHGSTNRKSVVRWSSCAPNASRTTARISRKWLRNPTRRPSNRMKILAAIWTCCCRRRNWWSHRSSARHPCCSASCASDSPRQDVSWICWSRVTSWGRPKGPRHARCWCSPRTCRRCSPSSKARPRR